MLVPPGPFAPRISYGLRPFAEGNGIVVCAGAHGVIPAKRKSRLLGNTVFAHPFVMLDVDLSGTAEKRGCESVVGIMV